MTDPAALVVLDTSAAINLNATGCARDILQALPNRLLVVDIVVAELENGRRRGRPDADLLNELVSKKFLRIVRLGNAAEIQFEKLVVGQALETLDDGEAATIAYAVEQGALAMIDERKAIRICAKRFPALKIGCTVDLLAHPGVEQGLGRAKLANAVVNALQRGRMRVLPHHIDWVVNLIGHKEAFSCNSLPRSVYRGRLQKLRNETRRSGR